MASQPDFSLFSSLRYDPLLLSSPENTAVSGSSSPCPFYLLSFHRDRMLRAAHHFGWPSSVTAPLENLGTFQQACEDAINGQTSPARVRTLLSPSGELTVETTPVDPVSLETLFPSSLPAPTDIPTPSWVVHIDKTPTPASPFTSHKTTSREHYMSARLRVGINSLAETAEVFMWNEQGEMMEGSMTSVYFWREGGWVTPGLEQGGNNGTTRRWLLEKGMVKEGVVERAAVGGEVVLMSNGVRGVWAGRVASDYMGSSGQKCA